jgi:hypothetical protein
MILNKAKSNIYLDLLQIIKYHFCVIFLRACNPLIIWIRVDLSNNFC